MAVCLDVPIIGLHIYPYITPQIGGGYPTPAYVLFNQKGHATFEYIGKATTDPLGNNNTVIKSTPDLLSAELVYRGTDIYLLRVGFCSFGEGHWYVDQRSFFVDKKEVSLISPRARNEISGFRCETFPNPPTKNPSSGQAKP